jgi:hypothetical protein
VVNIYQVFFGEEKKYVDQLIRLKDSFGGDIWCLVGDFNSV